MSRKDDSPWPDRDDELRRRWADKESTSQIGASMGVSKNSVVGRAHRIGLVRASPIKRGGKPKGPPVSKAEARSRAAAQVMRELAPATQEVAPLPPVRPFSPRFCAFPLWPHGERPGISPRFCDAPVHHDAATDRRSPYCPEHHRKCYAGLRYLGADEKGAPRFLPGTRAQPALP